MTRGCLSSESRWRGLVGAWWPESDRVKPPRRGMCTAVAASCCSRSATSAAPVMENLAGGNRESVWWGHGAGGNPCQNSDYPNKNNYVIYTCTN